jgi:uncharacterized protein (TIGR02145 family)
MSPFRKLFLLTLFCITALAPAFADKQLLAVLEFKKDKTLTLTKAEWDYLGRKTRDKALDLLDPTAYDIMTKENILKYIEPGKDLSDCVGECAVQTGQNINADFVVQGQVSKVGKSLILDIQLYETQSGRTLGNGDVEGKDINALVRGLGKACEKLFSEMKLRPKFSGVAPQAQVQTEFVKTKIEPASQEVIKSEFIDSRDGQKYKTVKIGNQVWMGQNLNYNIVDGNGSWCYENMTENCKTDGRLYDWNTAMNACPSGWHLPSEGEWDALQNTLGGKGVAGSKMKLNNTGNSSWDGSTYNYGNVSGFSGVPAGLRIDFGGFRVRGVDASFWEATEYNAANAYDRILNYGDSDLLRNFNYKEIGFSVRCVRD